MLVLPIRTVPALLSFSTTVASYGETKLSRMREPQVVRTPAVQKMSLCAIGIAGERPRVSLRERFIARRALRRAPQRSVTVRKAFNVLLKPLMRSSSARVSSTLEKRFARRPAASSAMVCVCRDMSVSSRKIGPSLQ